MTGRKVRCMGPTPAPQRLRAWRGSLLRNADRRLVVDPPWRAAQREEGMEEVSTARQPRTPDPVEARASVQAVGVSARLQSALALVCAV